MQESLSKDSTPSSQEERIDSDRGRESAWQFELRCVLSWSWLIPLVFVLSALLYSHATYIPPSQPSQPSQNGMGSDSLSADQQPTSIQNQQTTVIPERKARTPDYASNLRDYLELWYPLLAVLLTASVLAKEGRWGTITQLLLRRPLWWALFERLAYIYLYLLGTLLLVAVLTLLFTQDPPDQGNLWQWSWDVLSTVVPTTLFLCALALAIVHHVGNVAAGYIVTLGYWIANDLSITVLQASRDSDIILYTLFGWHYRLQAATPDKWIWGKLTIFLIALALFALQFPLLRQESRLAHTFNSNE